MYVSGGQKTIIYSSIFHFILFYFSTWERFIEATKRIGGQRREERRDRGGVLTANHSCQLCSVSRLDKDGRTGTILSKVFKSVSSACFEFLLPELQENKNSIPCPHQWHTRC